MVDLHNHTPLCKHAEGEPEEFVKIARQKGIKVYGFSDHAPMNFDEKYRMSFEEMKSYENLIRSLDSDIKILLGYEVDFTPFVDKRVLDAEVDYLIGSVHFLDNWGFDNPEFIKEWNNRDVDDVYREYFALVKKMAESKKFQIVGHFDLIKVFGHKPKKNILDLAKDAIKAIKKSGMVVEINTAGLRKPVKEMYPSRELLEALLNEGVEVTFGSDAHKPEQVGHKLEEAVDLAKSLGVTEAVYFENKQKRRIKI